MSGCERTRPFAEELSRAASRTSSPMTTIDPAADGRTGARQLQLRQRRGHRGESTGHSGGPRGTHPRADADASLLEGGCSKEDVHLRLHLPARPVGVARVESIYADGPLKNMVAGAGFPVILVPDEITAEQIRTRLLTPAGPRGADPEVMMKKRMFLQHTGYALHAALKGDQSVVGRLLQLHAASTRLNLPRMCRLVTVAMDHLDTLLEQKDLESLTDSDEQEHLTVPVNNVDNVNNGDVPTEQATSFEAEKVTGHKSQGKAAAAAAAAAGKMTTRARMAGAMVGDIIRFPFYYVVMIRPGLLMAMAGWSGSFTAPHQSSCTAFTLALLVCFEPHTWHHFNISPSPYEPPYEPRMLYLS